LAAAKTRVRMPPLYPTPQLFNRTLFCRSWNLQLINFVKFRAKFVMYYSQRLVSGTHIDVTPGTIRAMPYPLNGTNDFDKSSVGGGVLFLSYPEECPVVCMPEPLNGTNDFDKNSVCV
jgi:hypothetical protein